MGSSIPGNMANGYSGCGVSYSGATTRVAIRGYGFNSSGLVTVYEWESDSSSWSQMGSGIEFPDNGSYTSCPSLNFKGWHHVWPLAPGITTIFACTNGTQFPVLGRRWGLT